MLNRFKNKYVILGIVIGVAVLTVLIYLTVFVKTDDTGVENTEIPQGSYISKADENKPASDENKQDKESEKRETAQNQSDSEKTDIKETDSHGITEISQSSQKTEDKTTTDDITRADNTTMQTTTAKVQVPVTESETTKAPVIIEIKEEVAQVTENPIKYGVVNRVTKINRYNVYDTGKLELINTVSREEIDTSGYNATDDELKAESEANTIKYQTFANEVLRLVNEIRAEKGVQPLVLEASICNAANMRAVEMDYADYFGHYRSDGSDIFSVLDYFGVGYSAAGENIAAGYSSPESVVNAWKNSQGHYTNMINSSFTKLGVGYSSAKIGSYGNYWVQLFAD